MSDVIVFAVGIFIFAITVCGTIIGAGITLSRREIAGDPHLQDQVDEKELAKTFPVKFKY